MTDDERAAGDVELGYAEALRSLRDEGFDRVEKSLYSESIREQLERLERGPEAAREQRVRLVRSERGVKLFRVHHAAGRTYMDETPQAVVRRSSTT